MKFDGSTSSFSLSSFQGLIKVAFMEKRFLEEKFCCFDGNSGAQQEENDIISLPGNG